MQNTDTHSTIDNGLLVVFPDAGKTKHLLHQLSWFHSVKGIFPDISMRWRWNVGKLRLTFTV